VGGGWIDAWLVYLGVEEIDEGKMLGSKEKVLGMDGTVCDGNSGYVTRKRRWFIREWRS